MESGTNEKTNKRDEVASHGTQNKIMPDNCLFPPDGVQRDCRLTMHFCCLSRRRRCAQNMHEQDIKIRRLGFTLSRCAFIRQRVLICRVARAALEGRCVLCARSLEPHANLVRGPQTSTR